jgi:phospholipid/cholesterol/gamma-HCH transport system permease protein
VTTTSEKKPPETKPLEQRLERVRLTGQVLIESVYSAGYSLVLLGTALGYMTPHQIKKRWRDIAAQMYVSGVESMPVTLIVAAFIGFLLALSTGIELARYGQQDKIGQLLAVVMCREFGPFMTGLICAANVGSSMAAELGTMKVSEEIDALEVMSIDPARYLVLPRVIAMTLMCPVLTIFSDCVGIAGGGIIGMTQLQVSWNQYYTNVLEGLTLKAIWTGLLKAGVFGLVISTVGCSEGLRASGGAIGVGKATRQSVILSYLLILILGYYGTSIFYGKAM